MPTELGLPEALNCPCPRLGETEAKQGWVIPDIVSESEITEWAQEMSPKTLAAGSGAFFKALLNKKDLSQQPQQASPIRLEQPFLWLCGSAAAWKLGAQSLAIKHGVQIYPLQNKEKWEHEATTSLHNQKSTLMAIGTPASEGNGPSEILPEKYLDALVESAVTVVKAAAPRDLLIEGGATASALLHKMGWKHFETIPCHLSGLACLRPMNSSNENRLFIKPGSYAWPEQLWNETYRSRFG